MTIYEDERTVSRADLVAWLRQLADRLESDGQIFYGAAGRLTVADQVHCELEIERESGSQVSVEIEFSWTDPSATAAGDEEDGNEEEDDEEEDDEADGDEADGEEPSGQAEPTAAAPEDAAAAADDAGGDAEDAGDAEGDDGAAEADEASDESDVERDKAA